MGKSKRRILHKGINDQILNLTRDGALKDVVKSCDKKIFDARLKKLISLFGFSAEDLLEAGAQYEDVIGLKGVLKG